MNCLLDTHVLLWWSTEPERLSKRAAGLVAARQSRLLWSAASTWEVVIKSRIGKLRLPVPIGAFLDEELPRQDIARLPVEDRHAYRVGDLPLHHHDPFDRMLIAQAQTEGLSIISADPALRAYDVEVLW